MENQNFLQRPGGLGPAAGKVKPLGETQTAFPAAYVNSAGTISLNRLANLDNTSRISAQYATDMGFASRAPVGPVDTQASNIVPSQQITGPAGYNHNGRPVVPDRAADLTPQMYLSSTQARLDPNTRLQFAALTADPKQNFLNTQDVEAMSMPQNFNSLGTLPLQQIPNTKK